MTNNEKLSLEVSNSVFGDPWHGLSVQKILENISAERATARPIGNAHNILELILHLWAWTEEVNNRIEGNKPAEPSVGDWPDVENFKNESWNDVKEKYFASSNKLIQSLKNYPKEKLENVVGDLRDAPLGTGYSYEAMIHGLVQHNAYHAGQISLLKKTIT